MPNLSNARKGLVSRFSEPVVTLISRTPITPNALTIIGFAITAGAMAAIVTGHLIWGGIIILIGGLFDTLDGALARKTNRVTVFGSALDSSIDRLSDAMLLFGVAIYFANTGSLLGVSLAGATLIGSFLVSYIRAKAEALDLPESEVGIFTRTERVIVLALALILSFFNYVLIIALAVMAVLSFITAGQRLYSIWQQTKKR